MLIYILYFDLGYSKRWYCKIFFSRLDDDDNDNDSLLVWKLILSTMINFQLIRYLLSAYYMSGLYTEIMEKEAISTHLKDMKRRNYITKAYVIGRLIKAQLIWWRVEM